MSTEKESDSLFPPNAKVSVGFSDTFLLIVSLVGFGILTGVVYSIIVVKLKTNEEIDKENENEDEYGYEKRLVQADPSTLNRAERRARARFIRKGRVGQQRRRHHDGDGEDQDGGEQQRDIVGHDEEDGNYYDDYDDEYAGMTRKERQKAAKAAEREDRKLGTEKQQKQIQLQRTAQREKREREQKRQEEEKLRIKQERDADEQRARVEYTVFLMTQQKQQTVEEFIETEFGSDGDGETTNRCSCLSINDVAKSFGVSNSIVMNRLQQLIDERRITGIFISTTSTEQQQQHQPNNKDDNDDDKNDDDDPSDDNDDEPGGTSTSNTTYFVRVPDNVLKSIALAVVQRGEVSLKDIQELLITNTELSSSS